MKTIHKAAAVVIADNKFLMVRKVGKDIWTSLGGHVETDETPEQAIIREIKEEFNCDGEIVRKLGDFRARAAHDDADVLLYTFLIQLKGTIELIDPELEEYRFIGEYYHKEGILLPESIETQIIPYCVREGLLNW